MNRKLAFVIFAFVVGFGIVGQTVRALAAETTVGPGEEAVISPQDAAALKQGLDALEFVLREIDRRLTVAPQSLGNPATLNAALEGLKGGLTAIDQTLTARTLALKVPQPGDRVTVQTSPYAAEETEAMLLSDAALAPQPTAAIESGGGQLAQTERALGLGRSVWLAVIIAGLAVLAFLWFPRGNVEKFVSSAAPRPPYNPPAPAQPIAPAQPNNPASLMTTSDPNQKRP